MSVKDEKLSNQAYGILKQRIIERELKPKTKIDVNALETELQISKMPIKDAINRLRQEGLLLTQARVGTFVTPLDRRSLEAVFETRLMIEQWTVDSIVLHIRDMDIIAFRQKLARAGQLLHNATVDEFNYLAFTKLDQEFHSELIALCDNPIIIDMYTRLNSHMQIARVYYLQALQRSQEGQAEHEKILEAFALRDAQKARDILKDHLVNSRDGVLKLVDETGEI